MIGAAKKLGGKVVLGGHSLGASVVTADDLGLRWPRRSRRTGGFDLHRWREQHDCGERPGSDPDTPGARRPDTSPRLTFGRDSAPYAGLFEATGAALDRRTQ